MFLFLGPSRMSPGPQYSDRRTPNRQTQQTPSNQTFRPIPQVNAPLLVVVDFTGSSLGPKQFVNIDVKIFKYLKTKFGLQMSYNERIIIK